MRKNVQLIFMILILLFVGFVFIACSSGDGRKGNHIENEQDSATENDNEENIEDEVDDNDSENNQDQDADENGGSEEANEENESDAAGDVYSEIDIFSDHSETVLVNKHNGLTDYYEPEDLVTVEVPTVLENPEVRQLRQVAADALFEMFEEAKNDGIYLHARSGYRSHDTQVALFNNYAQEHGEEAANQFSARPGHSEHQTGLVMDVTSESVNFQLTEAFGETKEGLWIADNAHKFGFIIRYPEGKEDITGYVYEPWHLRYVGEEVAEAIYESGLTFEEFLVEEGIIHAVDANAEE